MKVLVGGGRDFTRAAFVNARLGELHRERCFTLIIEGSARGADTLGRLFGERAGIPVVTYKARWDTHGRAAGPIRNQQMLDEGNPTWSSPSLAVGTANLGRRARAAGVAVIEIAAAKS